jgi:hypothetical protein
MLCEAIGAKVWSEILSFVDSPSSPKQPIHDHQQLHCMRLLSFPQALFFPSHHLFYLFWVFWAVAAPWARRRCGGIQPLPTFFSTTTPSNRSTARKKLMKSIRIDGRLTTPSCGIASSRSSPWLGRCQCLPRRGLQQRQQHQT